MLGITHVSVSNNHINDYGEAAWNESKEYLVAAGIEPIGGYRNDGQPVITHAGKETIVFLAFEKIDKGKENNMRLKEELSTLKERLYYS